MKIEKESEGEYIRILLEGPSSPTAILNPTGEVYQANDKFEKLFDMDQLTTIKDLTNCDSARNWDKYLKLTTEIGHSTFHIDVVLPTKNMQSVKVCLIYNEKLEKIISYFSIPSLLKSEKEIRDLNVFRKSTTLMIVFDKKGIVRDVNELTQDFFDLPREYFIGKNRKEISLLFSVSVAEYEVYVRKVFKKGSAESLQRYERSPDDIRYYHINTFFDEESGMYIARVANHTKKVVLEQQLSFKEPLAEVGQLAASIAHEIRNPMTTLKGFTQLLRGSASVESNKYLDVIDDEIGRMESILSEMLVLSKPSTKEKVLISLDKIMSDMVTLVHPKARLEGVSFVQKVATFPEMLIYGDETKIKQVLLNLLKNALEAMSAGGIITIGLDVAEDNQIKLTITDTGKGMTLTQLNRIFIPYFTTRSEGTGLGLPFVIKTIENHGGTVSVSSKVGGGSSFMLSFPPAISQVKSEILEENKLLQSEMSKR